MSSICQSALILCPKSANEGTRQLLGLSVGERLLLALSFAGVKRVAFVGEGERPSCDRANLKIVEANELTTEDEHIVLASNVVFDRSLLSAQTLADDIALQYQSGDTLRASIANPDNAAEAIGHGHADSGHGYGIVVNSKADARKAKRALLLSLRKPMDGVTSRYLNRHVSLFITPFLLRTGLSPNFFTVVFMAIGLAAAYFATQAEFTWALVATGLLFQAQSILDGCDGEMARLSYQFSSRGQWLDSIGDDLTNYSVCFGLAIGQARVLDASFLYWLGGAVLAMQVLTSAVLYRRMLILGTGDLLAIPDLVRGDPKEGFLGSLGEIVGVLLKRDSFIFFLSILVIAQQPLYAFYIYGVGTLPMTIGVLVNEYRIGQQARMPDTAENTAPL